VKAWLATLPPEQVFLSVLVLGEIRGGIERLRRRDPKAAGAFEAWLAGLVEDCADRLLAVDARVAEEWGRMNSPHPLPTVDGLLAATAKVHQLTLVTRDTKAVSGTGVALLNPFKD